MGLLTKQLQEKEERMEEMKNKSQTKGAKGNRTTRVSGEALKNKLRSGEIPSQPTKSP